MLVVLCRLFSAIWYSASGRLLLIRGLKTGQLMGVLRRVVRVIVVFERYGTASRLLLGFHAFMADDDAGCPIR